MKGAHQLRTETLVVAEIGEVFEFFKDPRNLEQLTPPWLNFRIVSSSDEVVREGTLIEYRLRLYGIPLRWLTRITEYAESSHFADEQLRGPYVRWHHRHTFRAVPEGVHMTDEVDYELPLGPVGRLVHWAAVRHQLRAIFAYRSAVITKRFARR